MAASLEVRLPLLSYDLLLQAWRIPLPAKLQDGKSKSILRDILGEYVPKQMFERPKMGFSVPIGTWLKGPLRPWAEDLLASQSFRKSAVLDPTPIRDAWNEHIKEKRDHSWRLWTALLFLQWQAAG
jgi:asparagine synthase (glutamine-hydrolysing)